MLFLGRPARQARACQTGDGQLTIAAQALDPRRVSALCRESSGETIAPPVEGRLYPSGWNKGCTWKKQKSVSWPIGPPGVVASAQSLISIRPFSVIALKTR